ncbi:hypothetical protein AYK26_03870 [Euryarchaeota archaeon SM23-78]|nr:MAG: hypothetical protein AYK26_03870 [Euryarchaeota archaeon SM23-78]MBW3001099.1 branched-chain amino acid ABC transporter substrate-binding protein [Candidatus Woesearchaeota archaeon]
MKIKSMLWIILVGLMFSTVFLGCAESEQKTIKIVTSNPMRVMQAGHDIVNGVRLALEEVDYTVVGYKIELVVEDDGDENGQWQPEIEEGIARRAVADPNVMVYLGTYNSGAAKVSIPINNQGGLVQISPVNTWPGLTMVGFLPGEPGIFYPTGMRNYFRVCPTDAVQGPVGAVWAKELGFGSVYIFDDGEAYGMGIADLFEEEALEIGLAVLGHESINSENAKEKLNAIKDQNPDLIYFGGVTMNGAIPLVKGIKELGLDAKLMGPDGIMEQAFLDLGGDATEGTYLTVFGVPPAELEKLTEKGKEFIEGYRVRYNKEPGTVSSFGYEAAKVALLAIERAGVKDRAKILEEVSKIKDYDGLFGTWSFDQNGDTTLSIISGNIVQNKRFVFEKVLS